MNISTLQAKENMLNERVMKLRASMLELKKSLTPDNLDSKVLELDSLNTQLELSEIALSNIQERLREQETFLNSKEYKDKLKQLEKLSQQAERGAREVFEELNSLLNHIQEVEELARKAGKLEKETTLNENMLAYTAIKLRQPFSWLFGLKLDIQKQLNNAGFIQAMLEKQP